MSSNTDDVEIVGSWPPSRARAKPKGLVPFLRHSIDEHADAVGSKVAPHLHMHLLAPNPYNHFVNSRLSSNRMQIRFRVNHTLVSVVDHVECAAMLGFWEGSVWFTEHTGTERRCH